MCILYTSFNDINGTRRVNYRTDKCIYKVAWNTDRYQREPNSQFFVVICTDITGYIYIQIQNDQDYLFTWFVFRVTRRVPLVKQELHTLPKHMGSPPVFSGVRVTRSLVLYVCFVDRCLSFCTFSFGHCVVCSSSIYRF